MLGVKVHSELKLLAEIYLLYVMFFFMSVLRLFKWIIFTQVHQTYRVIRPKTKSKEVRSGEKII